MYLGVIAVADLGSNSFKLELAQIKSGRPVTTETLKESVRLGGGITKSGMLSKSAMKRGWDALSKFGSRLRGFDPHSVKIIATQTLRTAKNADEFLRQAEEQLGFPIEVISGREEAELTYLGVHQVFPIEDEPNLVIDIGGASTELVVGKGTQILDVSSECVGSVSWTKKYFSTGELTTVRFKKAVDAAEVLFKKDRARFKKYRWQLVFGSSGIISALSLINKASGHTTSGAITPETLTAVYEACIAAKHIKELKLPGLKEDRRDILAGGLSALIALMRVFEIQQIAAVSGATRRGALKTLIDDQSDHPIDRTAGLREIQQRYDVDVTHAKRIAKIGNYLLDGLALDERAPVARMIDDAAALHEIGLAVSRINMPRHSAYILENLNLVNFHPDEQSRLIALIRAQSGKLKKLQPWMSDAQFQHALMCFRVAKVLGYARRSVSVDALKLEFKDTQYKLVAQAGWIERNPQIIWLLNCESNYWERLGVTLKVSIDVERLVGS